MCNCCVMQIGEPVFQQRVDKHKRTVKRNGLALFQNYLTTLGIDKRKYKFVHFPAVYKFSKWGNLETTVTACLFKIGGKLYATKSVLSPLDEFYGPIGEKNALEKMYRLMKLEQFKSGNFEDVAISDIPKTTKDFDVVEWV